MKPIFIVILLISLAACEVTESEDVRTSGIYADYRITASGDGVSHVWAKLKVGGSLGTNLDLSEGEKLTAHALGRSRDLIEVHDILGGVAYRTEFDSDEPGTTYHIAYLRRDDTSAPSSVVTLPERVVLQQPVPGQGFQISDDIMISWNPHGTSPNLKLSLDARCPSLSGGTIYTSESRIAPDTGSYTISAYEIVGDIVPHVPDGSLCTVALEIERTAYGVIDENFGEGGRFTARQVDERTLTIRR